MKKIIIAEDSFVIQNLIKKILEIQKFSITSVKNGQEVLDMLNTEDYDLILMDINMPKIDGMECAKEIRKMTDPIKSKIPILAVTGNAKNYSIHDFKEVGIDEYIPKPLNFDILVAKVKLYVYKDD